MLLIHHFNVSHFKQNSQQFLTEITYFLYGETLLYIIDTLNMAFYIWVLFSAAQFHANFNLISAVQYMVHFVDNLVIIAMRFHWILGYQEGDFDPALSVPYQWLMSISIYCIVSAMCSLPCFILERCFATFHLKDYEKNQRRHISYLLVALLNVIGVFGTIVVLWNKSNTVYVVIGLIVPNVLAVIMNCFLRVWNRRKYDECKRIGRASYTLAKRFQVTENLKTLTMLHTIVFYMGFMNVLLVACLLVLSFDISPEQQAICSLTLDVSIFIYSFMLPQITTYYCKRWKTQTRMFKERIGCGRMRRMPSSVMPMREAEEARGTEMDAYFDQLRSTWERE